MPSRPVRRPWRRPLVVATALVATSVAAEICLALVAPVDFHRPLSPTSHSFTLLHQASFVPGLEYELVPGAAIEVAGWETVVHVNRFGLRGAEVEREKPPGTYRIAAIGDSFTFGHGVPDDGTFPHALERLLQEHASATRYEVLNFGVSGYSARDEEIVLRNKVGAFGPDLVLVSYVLNDPEAHSNQPLHRAYHQPVAWERFHVTRLVAKLAEERAIARAGGWFEYLHRTPRHWRTVEEAFAGMRSTAEALGVPVVLVVMPVLNRQAWSSYGPMVTIHEQVASLGRRNGFHVLDLGLELARRGHEPRQLKLPTDSHASPYGNRVFAEAILGFLRERFPAAFATS